MKYLKQFAIILTISFLGEILNSLIPLPVPASIYGIIIMLTLFFTGILKTDHVKQASSFLIEIMPIMFLPPAVGIVQVWDIIKPSWLSFLILSVASTVIVMAVAGLVTQGVIKAENRRKNK